MGGCPHGLVLAAGKEEVPQKEPKPSAGRVVHSSPCYNSDIKATNFFKMVGYL